MRIVIIKKREAMEKGRIIAVFLYRLNVPREEVEAFTDRIMHTTDLSLLRSWLKLSARVGSIEEFCEKAGF